MFNLDSSKRKRPYFPLDYTKTDKGPGPDVKKRLACEEDKLEGDTSSNDGFLETSTKIKSFDKFVRFSNSLAGFSHKQRVDALKAYMSPQRTEHDLYIELNGVEQLEDLQAQGQLLSLKLTLQEREFKSSSFREANLKENPRSRVKELYHVLRVYEHVEEEDPTKNRDVRIIKLYSSYNGNKGELSWVQKGDRVRGDTLFKIYEIVNNLLPIKKTYLFDDANLYFKVNDAEVKISLRKLKVLSSSLDTGKSWYEEKWGFAPATLRDFVTAKDTFDQNPQSYRETITLIRNTTLASLNIDTGQLVKRYITGKITEQTPLTLRRKRATPLTIHDLMKAMTVASRAEHTKKQAEQDLTIFFMTVLENFDVSEQDPAFSKAIMDLERMRIFTRINPLHIAS